MRCFLLLVLGLYVVGCGYSKEEREQVLSVERIQVAGRYYVYTIITNKKTNEQYCERGFGTTNAVSVPLSFCQGLK